MSTEILQTIVVTLVALAAAAVVVRRVFPSSAPRAGQEGCAGCPSAQAGCGTTAVVKAAVISYRNANPGSQGG